MGQIMKDNRNRNRKISYEDIAYSLEGKEELSYTIFDDELSVETVFENLILELNEFVRGERLSINEEKVGYCLIDVFENYEQIFIAGKGNKFNKNIILYQLREMSGLNTKEIRTALKPFKLLYTDMVEKLVNM